MLNSSLDGEPTPQVGLSAQSAAVAELVRQALPKESMGFSGQISAAAGSELDVGYWVKDTQCNSMG